MERIRQDQLSKLPQYTLNFNSQLAGLKNSLGLWEDMINKTSKLSTSLKTVIQCIGGFLEAFQKIADCAYGSNCGLKDLGTSMTRFCLRERGLESRLRTFNSQLTECLAAPLLDRLEEWKRSVAQLDRENGKEWRRAKSELQRATCELEKLSKRSRRKGSSASGVGGVDLDSQNEIYAFSTLQSMDSNHTSALHSGDNMHLNFVQHDLIMKQQTLAELERVSLRRAVVEERRRFAELLTCLKPVLDTKLAIFGDVSLFEESIQAIKHSSYDPNQIPSDIEEAIDYAVGHVTSNLLCDRKNSTSFGGGSVSSRSDSRCTMRSTKHSTGSSGLEYSSSTGLSCHASELSLQSSLSVSSANGSWNNNNGVGGSGSACSNYSQSTIHASEHCDVLSTAQNPATTITTDNPLSPHTISVGGAGDSVSLFENPDGSISGESGSLGRPAQNSVLDSINADWIPLPGLINKSKNINEHKVNTQDNVMFGFSPDDLNNSENENNVNVNHEGRSNNGDISGGTDVCDGGYGGGGGTTTEDTEDGETDDEKLDHDPDKSQQSQILYPNQAIPAPVYTNLNELKKAAARKFQSRNSPTAYNNNNINKETVINNNDYSSLYTDRKFSLQASESLLTPLTGESFSVSNINKFNSDSPRSSHVIWPPASTLDSETQGINTRSLCNTPITSPSSMNNSNNICSVWEYNHKPILSQSTYQNNPPQLESAFLTQSPYSSAIVSSSLNENNLCQISKSSNCCDVDSGYINTIVNSGTSTFRRRQSEYFKKTLDSTTSNVCSSPPPPPPLSPSAVKNSNYVSVTPGLMRRGSQACQQNSQGSNSGGRLYDRPVHPPRRSSSVSRELVSHNSSLNNINNANNNSNANNLLTINQHQHYSRLNLSDFAGNKNPSPFSSTYEQSTNNRLQTNPPNHSENNGIHHHYQQHQSNFYRASPAQQNQFRQQYQQEMFPSSYTPLINCEHYALFSFLL
ncbi:Metastasis suppressor protein isoform 1 [Schistosoma japonicum]|uniref:Metastasis suppressor protein isoform 1 n=2 Tax=Schistosoma japonicum TaxID=6182 RepID=A0A4Z2DQ19_SCHJA|nr:Metastasis suppressor protein isoform 1 [Schistosoma japonicum]